MSCAQELLFGVCSPSNCSTSWSQLRSSFSLIQRGLVVCYFCARHGPHHRSHITDMNTTGLRCMGPFASVCGTRRCWAGPRVSCLVLDIALLPGFVALGILHAVTLGLSPRFVLFISFCFDPLEAASLLVLMTLWLLPRCLQKTSASNWFSKSSRIVPNPPFLSIIKTLYDPTQDNWLLLGLPKPLQSAVSSVSGTWHS